METPGALITSYNSPRPPLYYIDRSPIRSWRMHTIFHTAFAKRKKKKKVQKETQEQSWQLSMQ